jgi:ATP-dependent Lhr-like helicase
VNALVTHFRLQEAVSEIPAAATCLVECVRGEGGVEHYVHTPLSRPGNDALARVAVRRLRQGRGRFAVAAAADLGLLLWVQGEAMPAEELRRLLDADVFDADLAAAIEESDLLRERFRRVALVGLMLLRNPLGGKRKVGGRDWAERRLFEQVRAADPEFVLLRQAAREVREHGLDAEAARAYVDEMPRRLVRCRRLAQVSPFAASWAQAVVGTADRATGPDEALERLHAALTGADAQ